MRSGEGSFLDKLYKKCKESTKWIDKNVRCGIIKKNAPGKDEAGMKATGVIRKVDELGRIVLPIEIRRSLDISDRDELEIYLENGRIVLQKFEPACIFCGSSESLVSYCGKNVCRDCAHILGEHP